MLKNDYSIIVESLEDNLSKINLFGMIDSAKDLSLAVGHIASNMDKFVIFEEDPEETEVIRNKLEEIKEHLSGIYDDIETETFSLITLLNNLRYLADIPKGE